MADRIESVIGGVFKFDTSDLKRGMTEANQLIRILDQELKASKAGINDWSNSVAGLTDQLDIMKAKLKVQRAEVKALKDAYSKANNVTQAEMLRMKENIAKAEAAAARTSKSISMLSNRLVELKQAAEETNKTNEILARGLSIVRGVAINLATDISRKLIASVRDGIRYALDFETAFKNVEKTVSASDYTLSKLRGTLAGLAQEIPKTAKELSDIAAIGGQLGISAKDLGKFTDTMARLGDSTNVTAENAALMIAQIGKQTNLKPDNFDRFSSALVDLGNNYATTESAILDMTSRLSAQGAIIGLTNQEILALSTVLAQTGLEAEAGGTAIQRLFKRFELASSTGKDLQKLAEIAGVKEGAFKDIFGKNAMEALKLFINGLKRLESEGTSVATSLADLGITEVRLTDTIQRLVLNVDEIDPAIDRANKAWSENTALIVESNKKYDTLSASLEVAKNTFSTFFGNILEFSSPAIKGAVDVATDFISSLNSLFDGSGKMGAAEFEKYMQELRSGFSGTSAEPDVQKTIDIFGIEHGIETFKSLKEDLADAQKEAADIYETVEDYNRQLKGPEKGNVAYMLEREKYVNDLAKAQENISDINAEIRDFAIAFMRAITPTNEVMDRLRDEVPELAALIDLITDDYTAQVAAEREAEEAAKKKTEEEVKAFEYTSKREKLEQDILDIQEDIYSASKKRDEARLKGSQEAKEYEDYIEDKNRELIGLQKQLEELDGKKVENKEKELDIDSYIAKYGTEEERTQLKIKKLEEDRAKLQEKMNKLSKDDVEQINKYKSAIEGINREITELSAPKSLINVDPSVLGKLVHLDEVKAPTSYLSSESRSEWRKKELENARAQFAPLAEKEGPVKFKDNIYDAQVFKDALKGIDEELEKLGEVDTSNWQDSIKKFLSDWSEALGSVNDIFDRTFGLISGYYEKQVEEAENSLERFNKEEDEKKDILEKRLAHGEISYSEYYASLNELSEKNAQEKQKKERELEEAKRKAFEAQKANDTAQAISSGAQAVTNALTVKPTWLGITLATTVGILAAAQVAQIAKQQYTPAFARGGMPEKGQYFLANEDGDEAITSYNGNPVVMPLVKHTEWMDDVAKGLAKRLNVIQGNNTVNNNNNKDYNIVQNIYAKPATRREIYLATRRACDYS